MKEQRYFTNNPTRYHQAAAFVAIVGMVVILLWPDGTTEARVLAVVNLVIWIPFFIRTLQLGAYSSPERLRIFNLFRTYDVPWEHVEQVVVDTTRWNGIAAVVEVADGRRIPCSGVQHRWMSTVEEAVEGECGAIARELNRDRRRYMN